LNIIEIIARMRELVLNGAGWATKDDVYSAFFHAVGAPDWHARNFDALAPTASGWSDKSSRGALQVGHKELQPNRQCRKGDGNHHRERY
jgi:Barstar (barnase inhibitor)